MKPSTSTCPEFAIKDKKDDFALDFILSILFASLNSFKGESLIKPLPSFVSSIEHLARCHSQIKFPPIGVANSAVENQRFIDWVSLLARQLTVLPYEDNSFVDLVGHKNVKQTPTFIVQLKSPKMSKQFENLASVNGYTIGFHGTHTENVFSILQNGLTGHLNKRALFGPGIYLSSDLDVALSFTKQGKSWQNSCICQNMTCVLVCKVINSDQVKKGKEKLSGISLKTASLPHNYYVVQNNDHIVVSHMFLYCSRQMKPSNKKAESKLVMFFRCYGFVLIYGLILVFICLGSKGVLSKWTKNVFNWLG